MAQSLRTRIVKWIAIGFPAIVIVGICWNVLHETPEEAIDRLGGKVFKQYRGPQWVPSVLTYVPGGKRLLDQFSIVEGVAADGSRFSREEIQTIASFSELRSLSIPGVDDEGLEAIGTLRNLQQLSIGHPKIPSNVTDAGLAHLANCTQLAGLSLERTRVTGAGLQHLRALSNLRSLNLTNTWVAGRGLRHLTELPNLERLDLTGTPISDRDMEHLRGLSAFVLVLRDTQITEDGLSWLNRANQIVALELSGTEVTDAVFRHFLTFPQLGRVNVKNTRVTPAGVDRFFQRTTLIDVQFDLNL